jgi:hypothetical protein
MSLQDKYLKYKNKYLNQKKINQSGSGRTYEQMPRNILQSEYYYLPADEKIYYNVNDLKISEAIPNIQIKYYSKLSEQEVKKVRNQLELEKIAKQRREIERLQEIRRAPYDTIITSDEYKSLPHNIKSSSSWEAKQSYQGINGYIKRPLKVIKSREQRLEELRKAPLGISISPEEYGSLPLDKLGFEWHQESSPYQGIYGYTKGKSLSEIKRYLNSEKEMILLKKRINNIEYSKLLPHEKSLYEKNIAGRTALEVYRDTYSWKKK